jgi:signal transduction histidine kinase
MLSRAIKNFGMIDATLITDYGLPYGMLIEMAIFSFALGNRINEIKRSEENEKALIRSRIASDLHDEIGSNLSSISVSSQMLAKSRNLAEKEKQLLEDITLTSKESVESIRDIIWFINPTNDSPVDIIQKMKETASKMLNGIEHRFICNDCKILEERDLGFRRNLFLIYKEILNNIVKHSQAKNVSINIFEKSKQIILEVEDDGIGFDNTKISGNGLGLKNIIRRAESLGGNASVVTLHGQGTKWKVVN